MICYDCIKELPLKITAFRYSQRKSDVSTGFTRVTTTIELHGAGCTGVGEDVVYDSEYHEFYSNAGLELPLAGGYDLEKFSSALDGMLLFTEPPSQEAYHDYRRWAFESAALDLALKQADTTLHQVLDLEINPVRFVVSINMSDRADISEIRSLLDRYPRTRFKLDAGKAWNDDFIAALADLDVVNCVDFKGQYKGTIVDQEIDPGLYRRIATAIPSCWLEDPGISPESEPFLEEFRSRVTWDAPIHSVHDIEKLAREPGAINIKPSRFGTVRRLFEAYDHCRANGIPMYGGGQFELGDGRRQNQYLASLFHPDGPNDLAPTGYNEDEPADHLPESPLKIEPRLSGFA